MNLGNNTIILYSMYQRRNGDEIKERRRDKRGKGTETRQQSAMDGVSSATPHLPWKTRLLIAVLSFAVDCCRRSNGTVNRSLMKFLDVKAAASTKPINGVVSSDVTVDPSRNVWFRLYTPTSSSSSNNSKLPVIVYFHGGGFIYFGPNSKPFDDLCRRLAGEVPAVVISVSYRLAPEYRYPCQYDDCFDALKFIDDAVFLPPNINADLSRCFLAGDSAGGNIAHHVTLRSTEHSFKKVKIKGVIAMQPFFGGEERTESELRLSRVPFVNTERTDWSWKAFLPEGSDRDHEAANVFGGGAENNNKNGRRWRAKKYPATLVIVGGLDPLQDCQRRYYEGLKEQECCGKENEVDLVEYPSAIHGFYIFPELPEASQLITRLRAFIQKQSAG